MRPRPAPRRLAGRRATRALRGAGVSAVGQGAFTPRRRGQPRPAAASRGHVAGWSRGAVSTAWSGGERAARRVGLHPSTLGGPWRSGLSRLSSRNPPNSAVTLPSRPAALPCPAPSQCQHWAHRSPGIAQRAFGSRDGQSAHAALAGQPTSGQEDLHAQRQQPQQPLVFTLRRKDCACARPRGREAANRRKAPRTPRRRGWQRWRGGAMPGPNGDAARPASGPPDLPSAPCPSLPGRTGRGRSGSPRPGRPVRPQGSALRSRRSLHPAARPARPARPGGRAVASRRVASLPTPYAQIDPVGPPAPPTPCTQSDCNAPALVWRLA